MNSFPVEGFSDISHAMEWLDQNLSKRPKRVENRTICSLMTEELLLRLLSDGQTEIRLTLRGILTPKVEITSKGASLEYDSALLEKDEKKRLEEEINKVLLTRYGDRIRHEYVRGVNRFRIDTAVNNSADLHDEIFHFYEQSADKPRRTLSLYGCIARNHPFMVLFGIANRTVKHTAVLFIPVFASRLVDSITRYGSFFNPMVIVNIILAAAALVINLICAALDGKIYYPFVRDVESALKMAMVQKLQILSMQYYRNTPGGKILSKLITDVQFIKQLANEQMFTILHLCIDIVFVCITAIRQLPVMLLLYAMIIPVTFILLRRFMPGIKSSKTAMRKQTEKSNSAFQEMLAMEQLNRSHGLESSEYKRILNRVRYVQDAANDQDWKQVRFNIATFGAIQGAQILSLSVAVYMAFQGRITVGTVILFKSLFEALINSIQKFLDELPVITQELDSLDSVNEILLASDTEKDGSTKLPLPVRGDVAFTDVSFGYSPDKAILNRVSFRIPAGKTAAFIGSSGSGKTTILNLLLGLYAPQAGSITIDGMDVNTLEKKSYRRFVAVVPQNPVLFTGTLYENLVYGLRYVPVSTIEDALRRTGLEDLVTEHPDGLNQLVQEGGNNFSGGQRQRIAIVRALLRNPRIILLDEATSALDVRSEQEVQNAIEAVMGSCTMLIVAHRLNTIEKADMVFCVDDGKIMKQS